MRPVALITGANSGVGFSLAKRLLQWESPPTVVLACRSVEKANVAREQLLSWYSKEVASISSSSSSGTGADAAAASPDIVVLQCNLSCVADVDRAVQEFKKQFSRLDYLFLNAGVILTEGMNFMASFKDLFTRPLFLLTTGGEVFVQPVGVRSKDEIVGEAFAANVFGHYILMTGLKDELMAAGSARVIWTGSHVADKNHWSLEDFQHLEGSHAYQSTKYAVDLLVIAMNQEWKETGIHIFTTDPGVCSSNIFSSIFPKWGYDLLLAPSFHLLRIFEPSLCGSTDIGCESVAHLAQAPLESLDTTTKYHTETDWRGRPVVRGYSLHTTANFEDALPFLRKVENLERQVRVGYEMRRATSEESAAS